MFLKVEIGFRFDRTDSGVEEYRNKAHEYDESDEEYQRLMEIADEIEMEDNPSHDEIYQFLSDPIYSNLAGKRSIGNKARYLEFASAVLAYERVHQVKLSMNHKMAPVLTFVVETRANSLLCDTMDSVIDALNSDDHLGDTFLEGDVGNELKFPSRNYPEDLLGELGIIAYVTEVTDITGEEETASESDEESDEEVHQEDEAEIKHPFYMTHEDLFGIKKPVEVDLDSIEPVKKKSKWANLIPQTIRGLFRS